MMKMLEAGGMELLASYADTPELVGAGDTESVTYDWGFSLVPADNLKDGAEKIVKAVKG